MARKNGLSEAVPRSVAELGPGDSIGCGLAALISGSEMYYGLDAVQFANIPGNLLIFDELVDLYKNKQNIPGVNEFPRVKPFLDSYDFPCEILTDKKLSVCLNSDRLERIRTALTTANTPGSSINYAAPWFDPEMIRSESVDLIFSQAVLQYVEDLPNFYRVMRSWLRPKGFVSHQIGFDSHGMADEWNGHWAYSDFAWKLVKGKRAFSLSRAPHSAHIASLEGAGFKIVCDQKQKSSSNLIRNKLAPRFRSLSDDDFTTSAAFIQAVKN